MNELKMTVGDKNNIAFFEPKISIIVPIYNVEKYLNKCIDSILIQTYKNIELILVDDESLDNCGAICDEYAKKDMRVRVIHKLNGGVSDARNAGIQIAKGEYIGFVDSDDWIAKDMYQTLYEDITKYNADISIISSYIVKNNTAKAMCESNDIIIMNVSEAIKQALEAKVTDVGVVFRLYNKKIFDESNIFQKGKINEDAIATFDFLKKADKIVFHGVPKYYYLIREGSIDNSKFKPNKLQYIEIWEMVLAKIKVEYPDLEGLCLRRLTFNSLSILKQFLCEKTTYKEYPEEYKKLKLYLKKYQFEIIKCSHVPFVWKLITTIGITFFFDLLIKVKNGR